MKHCIFQNNQNYLFHVFGGSLEVSHSIINHSSSFSLATAVSTSYNNTFTNTITYQIQFFSTFRCKADLPLPQGTLPETIIRTNEETMKKPFETMPRTYDSECVIIVVSSERSLKKDNMLLS